ncbi:hypothetical protein [Cupriavidus sp. D39]|uniref:hypothetical protein n=1 Tax=Cupriavidus sp. D39 TaxID=2997877 RepID=UPI002271278B|nr:hypothetical protein [Cupriavidus sp. D39]MCY0855743.1 hypothetical protein [Cupriavidus sp. D39]
MTNNTKLQPPANLDNTKLITPQEYDAWKDAWADYREAIHAEHERERLKEQSATAYANRNLTDAEYHAEAVKREKEEKSRQAERAAIARAEALAMDSYLSSQPDVADVCETSEYIYMLRLQHWFSFGYVMAEDSIQGWFPGYYAVKLHKPVPATKAKAK